MKYRLSLVSDERASGRFPGLSLLSSSDTKQRV
jgi:hypothetical protein